MSQQDDLVKRLREQAIRSSKVSRAFDKYVGHETMIEWEAAAEIERLQAQVSAARREGIEEAAQYHDQRAALRRAEANKITKASYRIQELLEMARFEETHARNIRALSDTSATATSDAPE